MTDASPSPGRPAGGVVWLAVAVVLLGVGAWCLTRGIAIGSSTGGLLTAPVREVRLHGGWLVGATAAVTTALIVALEGVGRSRRRR